MSTKRVKTIRSVAPEDIRVDSFVTVTEEILELSVCQLDQTLHRADPIRIAWRSDEAGTPLRVVDVCLPFLLVKDPVDGHRTIDLRRQRIVRLANRFGRAAYARLRADKRRCDRS